MMKSIFNIFKKIKGLLLLSANCLLQNCLLPTAHCLLPTAKLLTAFLPTAKLLTAFLPTAKLPTAYCKTAHCNLPTAKLLTAFLPTAKLPTAYCKTAHCNLPTAHCNLPTAYCKLLTTKLPTAICLLLFCQLATAQLYPVQVNQSIPPPYSTNLNSYVTATNVKLRLFLTMTDIGISNRQVRLKLKIQGNGLNIQSTNFVTGAPFIFLNGGSQSQLTNIDLAPYFELRNLQGITAQQYNQSLPEGSYKICWEVYDFKTNQLISNPNLGCSHLFLLLNDPPFLNLPNRADQLTDTQPTNIIFQWTPRHANATNVSYEFELKEIWDTQIDPQAGFLIAPPFYSETTYTTTLLYNIGKPILVPGKTYAWRVRAKSMSGLSENSIFKNGGYSEIYHFTYTNTCSSPTFALAEQLSRGHVKISWQTDAKHNKYQVQYKRADVKDAEWFKVFSYTNQAEIKNLQEGVTYDFRVGGTCQQITDFNPVFNYTAVNQFTMSSSGQMISYNCGIVPEIEISNTTPLGNLGLNETFTAGDFPVTVKEIQGGNGTYSGKGFIVVPYLADTKIAVEFTGIKINTEYQLYDGIIKTTYDPTWSGVEDVGDLFNGGAGQVNTNEVDFPIGKIEIGPNGDILIVGEGGAPVVKLPGGEDYTIVYNGDPDADPPIPPKVYTVSEDGTITEETPAEGGNTTAENTNGVSSNGEATDISAQGVEVTFTPLLPTANNTLQTVYGFDKYESSQSQTKDLYKKLGNNYYMPYKAVAKGQDDYIVANVSISNDSIQPHNLIFKTKDGVALTKIDSTATTYTLKLRGTFDDADVETHAVIKQGDKYQIAGAFIQYQVTTKEVEVVLVNTNNTSTQSIKDKLKEVYQQGMVNLTITEINNFDINSYASGNTIESGESGFLANYTAQQRTINNALKSRPDYKQNGYYLILTNKTPSTAGEKGLMPIGRQFGYVYTANCNTANCQQLTAAHELGHGAFQLRHPFSTHSYGWTEGATNWLLDYNNGVHLPYAHWKNIHNPNIHIGIFDGDGEGEYKGKWLVSKIIQKIRCAYLSGINEVSITDDLNYFDDLFTNDLFKSRVYQISLGRDTEYDFSLKFVVNRNVPIVLPQNLEAESSTYPGLQAFVRYDFGGLDIYTTHNSNTAGYSFEDYLQGNDNVLLDNNTSQPDINEDTESIILSEIVVTGSGILSDGVIDDSEFESLKNRAICELTYLRHNTRTSLIKALLKRGWRTDENEEDLILDLIHNIPNGDEDAFLEEIYEQPDLLDNLWTSLDNSHFLGAENNASRFLQELLIIWKKSSYYAPSEYTYTSNSPAILSINEAQRVNDALGLKYSINLEGTDVNLGIKRATRFVNFEGTRTLSYDIFQPLIVEFKSDTQWQIPQEPIPAFLLYAAKDIEDVKQMIKTLNFTFDVALTFTGVGNISKLRLLPKGLRTFKATIAGVEIGASLADLVLDYSSVCQGNEAVCQKLKLVTFALQIASLSVDLSTSQKVKIKNYAKDYVEEVNTAGVSVSKTVASELENLAGVPINNIIEATGLLNLLNKLDNFPHIRLWVSNLDEVSDVNLINKIDNLANTSSGTTSLLSKLEDTVVKYPNIKDEIVANTKLLDHFKGMHNSWYYRLGLAREYKNTTGAIDLPDNFGNALKDLDMYNGQTIRSAFDGNNAGAFGIALEQKMGDVIDNAWTNGITGIKNSDIPTDLKTYYEGIYNQGYTKVLQQVKIKTPQGNPVPDFFFFKYNELDEALDLNDVIYHDSKISVNSSWSNAQKHIKQVIDDAKANGVKAEFEIDAVIRGSIADDLGLKKGQKITISEMSKVGTSVIDDKINLIRKEYVKN